jgi:hypothetical protein
VEWLLWVRIGNDVVNLQTKLEGWNYVPKRVWLSTVKQSQWGSSLQGQYTSKQMIPRLMGIIQEWWVHIRIQYEAHEGLPKAAGCMWRWFEPCSRSPKSCWRIQRLFRLFKCLQSCSHVQKVVQVFRKLFVDVWTCLNVLIGLHRVFSLHFSWVKGWSKYEPYHF